MAKLPSDSIDAVPEEARHPGTTTEAFAPAAAPRMMQVPLVLKLAAGFVIVAGIYLASDALIPVVLALLFSFLLAPLVDRLRAWKVSRILAVMMAVGLATGVLLAVASFLSMQMYDLAGNLPTFQGNIEKKN